MCQCSSFLKHNYSIPFCPLSHQPLCLQAVLQTLSVLYFSLAKPSLSSPLNYSSMFMDCSDKNPSVLFHFILFCLDLDSSYPAIYFLFHLSKLYLCCCIPAFTGASSPYYSPPSSLSFCNNASPHPQFWQVHSVSGFIFTSSSLSLEFYSPKLLLG